MPSLPKPFRRPSIDLDGKRKFWKVVPVHQVKVGDMVQDHGRVEGIDLLEEGGISLIFLSGAVVEYYDSHKRVNAFTE